MFSVSQRGSRRRAVTGPSRIPAAACLKARAPVSSSAAAAATTATPSPTTATTAAAPKSAAVGTLYWSLCQFGNERIQFVLDPERNKTTNNNINNNQKTKKK
jgi:hypothetical protein